MSAPKDGGLAFPLAWAETNEYGATFTIVQPGMALRDHFAGQALAGILASEGQDITPPKAAARRAYSYADAMLEEREGGTADA